MAEYPEKLAELLEMLETIPDPRERVDVLVNYAEKFKPATEEEIPRPYPAKNKIPFCESGAYVWVHPHEDGTLTFSFVVENPQGISAKALVAVLKNTVAGEKAEKVANIPDDLVYKLFGQGLSMGKNMGLTAIVQYIKREAKKYLDVTKKDSRQ